ncbi:hypothetical protein LIA77_01425 [Sarocladium implicatum]|nr:hypothetical protein LIA77_01425 [Sarocladium implicatum]
MSFPYPPSGSSGPEMDMTNAPYLPVYPVPSQQHHPGGLADPRTSHLSMHEGREPDLALRRSFSTPTAVPYSSSPHDQVQLGLAGEKKRNKLGYHRTSVACGNCRKRKIRCVTDVNDKQGRSLDGRATTSTRGGSQRGPSASASPATSSGQLSEAPSKRPLSRQVLPPGMGQARGASQDDDDHASISDTSTGRVGGQSFELSGHPSATWGAPDLETSLHARAGDFGGQWPSSASMTEHFSSYDPSQASPAWQHDPQGQQPHEGFPWAGMSAPTRSMSYSGEGMPGHQQGHFTTVPPAGLYDRRASNFPGTYNPSIGGPVPNMEHAVFAHGNEAVGSLGWEEQQQQQQQAAVGQPFQKPEAFDSWAYGPHANGHQ